VDDEDGDRARESGVAGGQDSAGNKGRPAARARAFGDVTFLRWHGREHGAYGPRAGAVQQAPVTPARGSPIATLVCTPPVAVRGG